MLGTPKNHAIPRTIVTHKIQDILKNPGIPRILDIPKIQDTPRTLGTLLIQGTLLIDTLLIQDMLLTPDIQILATHLNKPTCHERRPLVLYLMNVGLSQIDTTELAIHLACRTVET